MKNSLISPSEQFKFHGGAASWLGVSIASALVTIFTLGFGYPWALTMRQRWITNNTSIGGRRLQFVGSGFGFIGLWIKMWIFIIITIGIYSFWVMPKVQKWITENTQFV